MTIALIADVGGTNVRFALVGADGVPRDSCTLRNDDYPGLGEAAEDYLARLGPAEQPTIGALAVASPMTGDQVTMTNRNWSFSVSALRRRLGLSRLEVVNDFTAIALGVPRLAAADLLQVGGGSPAPEMPVAVIGPGTGLGVSGLVPLRGRWIALATEGGHVTMAAFDEREAAILARLRRRMDHVSAERVVSGMGLTNLYAALAEIEGRDAEPLEPEDVTGRAAAGACPLCTEAVEIFCAMLGTVAGNLALTLGARGGVYIAGGIVPRLGDAFLRSGFRRRFESKGRMSPYVAAIPTWLVQAEVPAFLGLAALLEDEEPGIALTRT